MIRRGPSRGRALAILLSALPFALAGRASAQDDTATARVATADEIVAAGEALDLLERAPDGGDRGARRGVRRAVETLRRVAPALPADDAVLAPRIAELITTHAVAPTPDAPLRDATPLHQLVAMLERDRLDRLSPDAVEPHPTASGFPGAVAATAPRVAREVVVRHRRGRWRSRGPYAQHGKPTWHGTGLYAAPGDVISVRTPAGPAAQGLSVRIGCHTDSLWRRRVWPRMPEISRSWPLDAGTTRIASPFGGLLYVEVPHDCDLDEFSVEIEGAVAAPRYVLGETDPAEWAKIRAFPAPWAELETDKLVITVPSRAVRALDPPTGVLELWNRVLDAQAELAGWPLEPFRPERFVTDVEISAGYMHSGYPLMTKLDIVDTLVSKERLEDGSHHGIWGLFHELGHNHQSAAWTFRGTTEVTCNLFTLYTYDRVFGVSEPRASIYGDARKDALEGYLGAGADFETWKAKPFLALIMYAQLAEEFGWEAYRRVFREYRELHGGAQPRSDDDKRDEWLVRFSKTVGHDLGPFFRAWGVPTSASARAQVAALPGWMPAGFARRRDG